MTPSGRWRRVLGGVLLAVGLQATTGCLGWLHPIKPVPPEVAQPCLELPGCCRDHVYVFLINGIDIFDTANLRGLRGYLNSLGFRKAYSGEFYHTGFFQEEILRLREQDADARFVVIGFSMGARKARSLVHALQAEGVPIDLLVYLDGKSLMYTSSDLPENAGRVVNVVTPGYLWTAPTLEGAENVPLNDVWHFGVPSHPQTLHVLARELAAVAAAVPHRHPARLGPPQQQATSLLIP